MDTLFIHLLNPKIFNICDTIENILVSVAFLNELSCLNAISHLMGRLLKSDKFYDGVPDDTNQINQKIYNQKSKFMKYKYTLLAAIFGVISLFILPFTVKSQEVGSTPHFKVSVDLVSSYVWRGSLATSSPTPNLQPTLAFTKGNFEIGVWGSTDFTGSYKEVDPYISYTAGQFKLTFTDYNWNFDKADYFDYSNSKTAHRLEGSIGYAGSEKLPLSITWNTMFYGFDKKADDTTKQAFSTYIELGYTKGIATVFFGFTPWTGLYNNYGVTSFDPEGDKKSFSIVNIGASVTKAVKITDSFSLPVKATLIVNPSATYTRGDYVSLVIGITL